MSQAAAILPVAGRMFMIDRGYLDDQRGCLDTKQRVMLMIRIMVFMMTLMTALVVLHCTNLPCQRSISMQLVGSAFGRGGVFLPMSKSSGHSTTWGLAPDESSCQRCAKSKRWARFMNGASLVVGVEDALSAHEVQLTCSVTGRGALLIFRPRLSFVF